MNMTSAAILTGQTFSCPDGKCEQAILCDQKCFKLMTDKEKRTWEIERSFNKSWLKE